MTKFVIEQNEISLFMNVMEYRKVKKSRNDGLQLKKI